MRLKNIMLVVSDVEKSKNFYQDLFGLQVVVDMGENIVMTEGLVLQGKEVWEKALDCKVEMGKYNAVLYFEETNLECFQQKLEESQYDIQYLHPILECNGQRILRMYDLDGHIIEVRGEKI